MEWLFHLIRYKIWCLLCKDTWWTHHYRIILAGKGYALKKELQKAIQLAKGNKRNENKPLKKETSKLFNGNNYPRDNVSKCICHDNTWKPTEKGNAAMHATEVRGVTAKGKDALSYRKQHLKRLGKQHLAPPFLPKVHDMDLEGKFSSHALVISSPGCQHCFQASLSWTLLPKGKHFNISPFCPYLDRSWSHG